MIRNPNTCPYCHRGCGCGCGKGQPLNRSNQTFTVPVEGVSAYETFLAYNPNLDPNLNPDSPWDEAYWLNRYVKGEKGDKGDGVQIKGTVTTYGDLSFIADVEVGDSWFVASDGLLYTYGEDGWPAEGEGIPIKGDPGEDGQQTYTYTEW